MRSMTGYATASKALSLSDGKKAYALSLSCEIKTLNNKFFELSLSLPSFLYPYEAEIRSRLKANIARGKTYAWIKIESGAAPVSIRMDEGLLEGVMNALTEKGITDVASALSTIPFETLFTILPASFDERAIEPAYALIDETARALNRMRDVEGNETKSDFIRIGAALKESLLSVKTLAEESANEQFETLKESMRKLLAETSVDDQRLIIEAGILANRINVNEEIKRLESHLLQYDALLEETTPLSKRLEFLSQELLRETNTIGSKTTNIEITRRVVLMKTLIEEMKEQIRNIE